MFESKLFYFLKNANHLRRRTVDPNRDPGEILAKSSFPTIIRLTQLAIIHLEIQAHIFLIEKAFDDRNYSIQRSVATLKFHIIMK